MKWRKQVRQSGNPSNPNFLFSLPPFVYWGGEVPMVVVKPTGGDDTPTLQAAANRLTAIGGGVMRFTTGDFHSASFYINDQITVF